jgi:hypothetical protein
MNLLNTRHGEHFLEKLMQLPYRFLRSGPIQSHISLNLIQFTRIRLGLDVTILT